MGLGMPLMGAPLHQPPNDDGEGEGEAQMIAPADEDLDHDHDEEPSNLWRGLFRRIREFVRDYV